ncbi:hypothetical protein DEFDS_P057 (plasmid) [Deferribacter desulfuricans SSM1]|uniref:Uncharacterized protein n=1 Tax=Deferribacter desulfuricans (strain DSM 14783 / JCM 11476 / NBRC 101012 / SSM1) TaxID=639282 RepID=D3PEN9_DEFDS|nr:hypothetical protein [Deferribacter desulfuricans]BAI81681.1 hypothetical protein DEFDS_P057 [Deferribacter desulfuricans SSM1]
MSVLTEIVKLNIEDIEKNIETNKKQATDIIDKQRGLFNQIERFLYSTGSVNCPKTKSIVDFNECLNCQYNQDYGLMKKTRENSNNHFWVKCAYEDEYIVKEEIENILSAIDTFKNDIDMLEFLSRQLNRYALKLKKYLTEKNNRGVNLC